MALPAVEPSEWKVQAEKDKVASKWKKKKIPKQQGQDIKPF